MNDTEKKEILSLSTAFGEIAFDSLMKDGLFKDIPFIGTGISVGRLMNSASDRILLIIIIHFINDLGLKNQTEINEFKEKYFKDKDYKRIGSRILLIIERADDATKLKWLAKSLRLFIDQELSQQQFHRFASIINSAFPEDVQQITVFDSRPVITSKNELIDSFILDHLFSIGLLESHGFDGGDVTGLNAGTMYALKDYGNIMRNKII